MSKLLRYQFWNMQHEKKIELLKEEKYDINHNEFSKKNVYIGRR